MSVDRNRFASFDFRITPRIEAPPMPPSPRNGHTEATPKPSIASPIKPRRGWWPFPGIIFLLLATNICIVCITALYAVSDNSFSVEPEYYKQAVNWDQTMAQRERNRALGWSATLAPSTSGKPIVLRLNDERGEPVNGARIAMLAFHNAHSGNRLNTSLLEIDPGMYRSTESLVRSGSWEVRISATRGDEMFTAIISHDVRAKEASP